MKEFYLDCFGCTRRSNRRSTWYMVSAGRRYHPVASVVCIASTEAITQGMKFFGLVDNYTGIQSHATLQDKVLTAQNRQDSSAGAADACY